MSTAVLEINNDLAYSFLHNLEQLHLLRIVSCQHTSEGNKKQKMSERFAGALKLTDEQYASMQNELTQMRNEWERNIF